MHNKDSNFSNDKNYYIKNIIIEKTLLNSQLAFNTTLFNYKSPEIINFILPDYAYNKLSTDDYDLYSDLPKDLPNSLSSTVKCPVVAAKQSDQNTMWFKVPYKQHQLVVLFYVFHKKNKTIGSKLSRQT
ncbi:MAG: hypothetical protein EOP34_06825 [Rickettsiales bacterium]|nr:MAG: hypothetical protein EOP34_06825 [Rickettsiales bacterium]